MTFYTRNTASWWPFMKTDSVGLRRKSLIIANYPQESRESSKRAQLLA